MPESRHRLREISRVTSTPFPGMSTTSNGGCYRATPGSAGPERSARGRIPRPCLGPEPRTPPAAAFCLAGRNLTPHRMGPTSPTLVTTDPLPRVLLTSGPEHYPGIVVNELAESHPPHATVASRVIPVRVLPASAQNTHTRTRTSAGGNRCAKARRGTTCTNPRAIRTELPRV
jgi:hypothetical protein